MDQPHTYRAPVFVWVGFFLACLIVGVALGARGASLLIHLLA